jgi:REP element-mobilizing transposase RayT
MIPHNNEHRRKNIRLQGYDYARAGLYFLTVVVQNRLHLFGQVVNGKMILNDAGRMVEKWYREIENKYPDKRCREMVVMPNHIHCIIENMRTDNVPSTDTNVWKMNTDTHISGTDTHVGVPLRGHPEREHYTSDEHSNDDQRSTIDDRYGMHNKKYGATIGDVMDWFKTMTTNEYIRGVKNDGWRRFDDKLWQRNYYDHIIRDWQDDVRISTYIIDNPAKWERDKFNDEQQ